MLHNCRYLIRLLAVDTTNGERFKSTEDKMYRSHLPMSNTTRPTLITYDVKDPDNFMTDKSHWEGIYTNQSIQDVSWYREHLNTSLDLIRKCALPLDAKVIDIGGGASTLADDLCGLGYVSVSVLDISKMALEKARQRLGVLSDRVEWMEGDITRVQLPVEHYDLWHDRAVFHFLTDPLAQHTYVEAATRAVKSGGFIIIATFSPEGPVKCSGLPVQRYDAASLARKFPQCDLLDERQEDHKTPAGASQSFTYVRLQKRQNA
jgi:SAM-dependent methyltransferase